MNPHIILTKQPVSEPPAGYTRLYFILGGSFLLLICGNEVRIQSGDVLMVSSGCQAADIRIPDSPQILSVFFRTAKIDEMFGQLLFSPNDITQFLFQEISQKEYQDYMLIPTGGDEVIRRLFAEFTEESLSDLEFRDIVLRHQLILLITELIRRHKNHVVRNIPAPLSAEGYALYSYITTSNFRITLADVAEHFYISPAYASRYVRRLTGVGFSTLLKNCRFYVATLMLATTSKSISAISEQVGYDNPENFVRAFKQEYHMTPSQYRLKNNP